MICNKGLRQIKISCSFRKRNNLFSHCTIAVHQKNVVLFIVSTGDNTSIFIMYGYSISKFGRDCLVQAISENYSFTFSACKIHFINVRQRFFGLQPRFFENCIYKNRHYPFSFEAGQVFFAKSPKSFLICIIQIKAI